MINQQAADMEKAGKITKNMEGRLKLAQAEPSREKKIEIQEQKQNFKILICSLKAGLASIKFENHVLGQLQSAFHVLRDSSSLHRLPAA